MNRLTPDNPRVVWEADARWKNGVLLIDGAAGAIYIYGDSALHGSRIRITAEVIPPNDLERTE